MKKSFSAIMIIIGTVIGSGFASGKEVAVFFSRFGSISYFFISLTFFLFFGIIYFFLSRGERALSRLTSSKLISFLCVIISLIFTSSMFAGTINVLPQKLFLRVLIMAMLVLLCIVVAKRGVKSLALINSLLIPITIVAMFVVLISGFDGFALPTFHQNGFAGLFFAQLYAVLNFSISSVVIAETGQTLTKKQKACVSFVSSFVLSAFLMLTNVVLLANPELIAQPMPLVSVSTGLAGVLIKFVIFSGCITTLFSLVWTTRLALERFGLKMSAIVVVAVFLPIAVSLLGFGQIVSFLYPFASIIGALVLFCVFLLPKGETPP